MYYYIFEPPQGAKEYERTAQIKEHLGNLGIAGEMTSPQPGRSVEDLVQLALSKRYSTIVAVGGVQHMNQAAKALENQEAVFGVIPYHPHPDIAALIGTDDWKLAAENLKKRRWQNIQIGHLNQQVVFLTPATIPLTEDTVFEIATPDFEMAGRGGQITVQLVPPPEGEEGKTRLQITIRSQSPTKKAGLLRNLFGNRTTDKKHEVSQLLVEEAAIHTSHELPVLVADTALCNTPVTCSAPAKPFKLIVGRGTSPKQT